jgi:hypothetical protein
MFTWDFGVIHQGVLVWQVSLPGAWGGDCASEVSRISGRLCFPSNNPEAREGGDLFWLDQETLVIGNGNRSTYAGYEQAKEIPDPYGQRVFVIESSPNGTTWTTTSGLWRTSWPWSTKMPTRILLGMLDGLGWELIRLPGEYG